MNAEILCVGTELLLGEIVNTNAAAIARALAEAGVTCHFQSVVGDNPMRLREALAVAMSRADLVITSGGLGPTGDDVTKEVVSAALGRELHEHQPSRAHLDRVFARTRRAMTPNNLKQALMPTGAIVFDNDRGTANGLALVDPQATVIMLPGPPAELEPMLTNYVVPFLQARSGQQLVSLTIHFFGIGESALEAALPADLLAGANPTAALYAGRGEVRLRVTASAPTRADAEALVAPVVAAVTAQFPQQVYGVDVADLESALVAELGSRTIATAESCTGGLIAARITSVPGSSAVFGYGLVTYANAAKERLLGVRPATLAEHGAVSPQVAVEMAEGVRAVSGADIAVATTGVAGPDGGSPDKPVGLVWLAVASDRGTHTVELRLSRGYREERNLIRHLAASHALFQALREAQAGRH